MQGARPKLSWSDGDNEGGGGERFHGCVECFKGGPPLLMVQKSCTTSDVQNSENNGINYLSTGAGFYPSTVQSL